MLHFFQFIVLSEIDSIVEAPLVSMFFRCLCCCLSSYESLFAPLAVAGRIGAGPSILPSFHPSVFLSGSFLGMGSLFFSETQHGVRDPCVVVRESRIFFFLIFVSKMGKMEIGFFGFLGKFIL